MKSTPIPMDSYPRKLHFEHFTGMENPFAAISFRVDITKWLQKNKAAAHPFYLSLLYAFNRAANSVPAFRHRICDGRVIEYDECPASYTVGRSDGTYGYTTVSTQMERSAFLSLAKALQQQSEQDTALETASPEEVAGFIFYSCLPNIACTAVLQPWPDRAFSNPMILWGKYTTEPKPEMADGTVVFVEKTFLPVTVQFHHALMDGMHISAFLQALEKELDS